MGGPQSPRALSGDWGEVADAIGFGGVTFHALRHTHASMLIDAGVDVVRISRRLGHASPNITLQVYAHLFQKHDSTSRRPPSTRPLPLWGKSSGKHPLFLSLGANRVPVQHLLQVELQLSI